MTKLRIVCATAALAATASGAALADTSANYGIMSDYIFRGVYQTGATAFAGIDIETGSGFYMGAWGTNLHAGLEYDIYMGYAHDGDVFDWYAGLTGYYYTDEFDDTYQEVNAGFTYGFMSLDIAIGDYKIANGVYSLRENWAFSLDDNDDSYPDAFQGGTNEDTVTVNGFLDAGEDMDGDGYLDLGFIPSIPNGSPAFINWQQEAQTYTYMGFTFAPERGPYYFVGRTDYKNIDRPQYAWSDIPLYNPAQLAPLDTGRWSGTGSNGYWVEIGKSFELMDDLEFKVAALYSGDVQQYGSTTPSSIRLAPATEETRTSEYALVFTLTKTISGLGD